MGHENPYVLAKPMKYLWKHHENFGYSIYAERLIDHEKCSWPFYGFLKTHQN